MKKSSMQGIQGIMSKIINFIRTDIWRMRLGDLPFGKSFLIRQLRVIILTIRGFDEDRCFSRASSLTFYTLLSIVPVVAMLFGVAKGFGFEKMIERDLLERFPGQEEVLTQVIGFAQSLLEATKGGVIAGIGLVILFWAVIKLLSHIEASFNEIWEIKEHRTWGRKFSDYLAVMLLSPLLVLMSSSVTVFITTQVTQVTNNVKVLGMISPLIFSSLKLIPYVLIWILFTVIYVLMPNTKVNLKAGIFAGIIASQNVDTYEYEPDSLKISPAFKKLLTLQIAHLLIQSFSKGEKPPTDFEISRRLRMPIRLVHNILFELVESGLVNETKTKEDKIFGYQPARDIDALTINYILETLEQNGTNDIPVTQTEELTVLSEALQEFSKAIEASPANRLLKNV
ncbi:hypothetical protein ES703_25002 [subsurface metagenome]